MSSLLSTLRPAPRAVAAAVPGVLATLLLIPTPAAAFECYQGCADSLLAAATLHQIETFTVGGTPYERFRFHVENSTEYPQELFDPAPNLPPCGLNTSAPRTWVNVRGASDHKYLYGFCSFGQPSHLDYTWFARPAGTAPAAVYIELEDRQTGRRYRSNDVSTSLL